MRVQGEKAFVLLNRAYSESSWISEIFSRSHGRLVVMAKGARRVKSPHRGILLPMQALRLSWSGRGEVPTLTSSELDLDNFRLRSDCLLRQSRICGIYCNEMLVHFLHRHDPHPQLYDHYQQTLKALARFAKLEDNRFRSAILRSFEKRLITECGYGVNFLQDSNNLHTFEDGKFYQFKPTIGFVACAASASEAFDGRLIRQMHILEDPQYTKELLDQLELGKLKRLMRDIMRKSLQAKPIVSRSLLQATKTQVSIESRI